MTGNIQGINSVKVDKWGAGDKNDCWWNIAKNQAGESATTQEIQALSQKLQEYNKQKNSAIVRQNGVLQSGEQVFIPLEYAMDEIKTSVSAQMGKVSDAQKAYQDILASQKENGGKIPSSEIAKCKQNVEAAKKELEALKNELEEIKKEYSGEKEEYENELKEIDNLLTDIDTKITETKDDFQSAKEKAEAEKKAKAKETEQQPAEDEKASKQDMQDSIINAKVQALHAAVDRAGTDESVIKEIVNGKDMQAIKEAYDAQYGKGALEKAIKGDFSGKTEDEYLDKLANSTSASSDKDINEDSLYNARVLAFNAATTNRLGTDETALKNLVDNMDDKELRAFVEKYNGSNDSTVEDIVKAELSGKDYDSVMGRIYSAMQDKPAQGSDKAGQKDAAQVSPRPSSQQELNAEYKSFIDDAMFYPGFYDKNSDSDVISQIPYAYARDLMYSLNGKHDSYGNELSSKELDEKWNDFSSMKTQMLEYEKEQDDQWENYNPNFAKYLEENSISLSHMYLEKLDENGGNAQKAQKEMTNYINAGKQLLSAKSETDAVYTKFKGYVDNQTPAQNLLSDTYDTSSFKNYDTAQNAAYGFLENYKGEDNYSMQTALNEDLSNYNSYKESLKQCNNLYKSVDTNADNNLSSVQKDLIDTYNECKLNERSFFPTLGYTHEEKQALENAETLIKSFASGEKPDKNININDVISTLKGLNNK